MGESAGDRSEPGIRFFIRIKNVITI